MASNDIEQFYFYPDYLWRPEDFNDFQTWLFAEMQGAFEGGFGAAVLKGLRVLPSSGLTVTIDPGIAASDGGQLMVLASQATKTLTAPMGNPAKSLIVMRPKTVDKDNIPEPLNPSNPVPLHKKLDYDLLVLQGTPAASPAYPATTAGDVVVMGFTLAASQSTITRSDMDLGVVDRVRRPKKKIQQKVGTYLVQEYDDVVELDASAAFACAQLPPAGSVEGMQVTVVRVDAGSFDCPVSGNGAETISGQNSVNLDTQWQSITVYSNGLSWRSI